MPGVRSGTAFRGVTGGMPRRLAAPGGACPRLTLGLDPGTAALQFAAPLPGRNSARQASRPGHGHSLPPAGGLVQDRPERAPDPLAPPLLGEKTPKGRYRVVSSQGEWLRSAVGVRAVGAARRGSARRRHPGGSRSGGRGAEADPQCRCPACPRPGQPPAALSVKTLRKRKEKRHRARCLHEIEGRSKTYTVWADGAGARLAGGRVRRITATSAQKHPRSSLLRPRAAFPAMITARNAAAACRSPRPPCAPGTCGSVMAGRRVESSTKP
jgi:hypothetical protein